MQLTTKEVREKQLQKKKRFEKLQNLQYDILGYSGLQVPSQIHSRDVQLIDDYWIHEICCGFNNQKHIVLLHGYGGSALTFIRLFKPLAQKYYVHALDHMGMGLSGRRIYSSELKDAALVDYFIDAVEQWRQKSGIKSLTMVGHSFGGYIAAAYAVKYPESVERLVLISPVGTKFTDKQSNEKQYNSMREKGSFQRKMFLSMAKTMIGWEITPSRILNWAIFGNMFLNRIVESRLKLQDKQKDLWKQYFKQVSKLTPNSEASFWRLFYMPGAGTANPTSKMFSEIKLPFGIQFYYGDSDWMEKQTAYSLAKSETPNRISYRVVKNSGHQIVFDNPQLMAEYILDEDQ